MTLALVVTASAVAKTAEAVTTSVTTNNSNMRIGRGGVVWWMGLVIMPACATAVLCRAFLLAYE
jgi:hypothetical protein